MNISEIGTVFGISLALLGGGGTVGKYYADHEYVTIAAQNQSLMWDIEDEIARIESRIEEGVATESDRQRKAVLQERLKHLQ